MYRLYLLGHSHVDVVWLWPIEETKLIVKKLFRHILNLMEKYSYFTYAQSTTLYYKWIAEDRDIMDRLREFTRDSPDSMLQSHSTHEPPTTSH